jgi:hypothetical protein
MSRATLIGGLFVATIVSSRPATVQAQGAFTVSLSDSTEALIFPDTVKLGDLTVLGHFTEPGAFREAVTRSILLALEADDSDLEIKGVFFYTLRIREMSGEHRELGFPIGNYATVEVRKKAPKPEPDPPEGSTIQGPGNILIGPG